MGIFTIHATSHTNCEPSQYTLPLLADDSQLYRSYPTGSHDQQTAKSALEQRIARVAQWMFSNRSKLNMKKPNS